ncbi:hypothetical protein TNCV_3500191 [Trichonephila clavipes]|nr:hypothetical protein TNCV_3500191 [Trichonephila clavipes]
MTSPVGYTSSPVHRSRWLPYILVWPQGESRLRQQLGQASGGYTPKTSCVRWLGESEGNSLGYIQVPQAILPTSGQGLPWLSKALGFGS